MKRRIMSVFGTRPEAIKMAPLVRELADREGLESLCCLTGQHRQNLQSLKNLGYVCKVKADSSLGEYEAVIQQEVGNR